MPSPRRPVLVALALAVFAATASPQRILDPFGDATLPRPGTIRIGLGGRWDPFDRLLPRSAGGPDVPLGAGLIGEPTFAPGARRGVRRMAGDSTLLVTEGFIDGGVESRNWAVPITLEVGITRRLAFVLDVPIVRASTSLFLRPNPVGTTATLGLNPALRDTAALRQASQTWNQLAAAENSLRTARPDCFGAAPGAGCTSWLAALGQLLDLRFGVREVYLGGTMVPLAGGRADSLTRARFASVNTQLRGLLGVSTDPVSARPVAAPSRLGLADVQALAQWAGFDSLGPRRRITPGDAGAGLTLRLFDSFGDDTARLRVRGFRLRSAVQALYRVGTGHAPVASSWADQGTGTNAAGADVRLLTDVQFDDRVWLTVGVRRQQWGAERATLRLRGAADGLFSTYVPAGDGIPIDGPASGTPFPLRPYERQRGAITQVDVVPRVRMTDYLQFTLQASVRHRAADRFTWTDPAGCSSSTCWIPPADALPTGLDGALSAGGTDRRVGVGITWSTLAATRSRGAGVPFEVALRHDQVIGGTGLPRLSVDAIQLRWWWAPFGR